MGGSGEGPDVEARLVVGRAGHASLTPAPRRFEVAARLVALVALVVNNPRTRRTPGGSIFPGGPTHPPAESQHVPGLPQLAAERVPGECFLQPGVQIVAGGRGGIDLRTGWHPDW